jgi:protein-disulfide isomerase
MNWRSVLHPWPATAARLIVGALFIWSAVVKFSDPRAFLRGVVGYDVTPDWLSRAIAYGLPALLLCLGLMLVVGILVRVAAGVAGVLQVLFLIGVIELGVRGIKVSTGAFSTGGVSTHPTQYLLTGLLNVVLIALAAIAVLSPHSRLSLDEFLARGDYVEPPSSKRLRTEQGRRKHEAELAIKQKAAAERHRYLAVGIMVPVVLISFVAIGVQANRTKAAVDGGGNASHVDGVSVGFGGAPVTIDVFEDFQSRQSLAFEKLVGADLDKIAQQSDRQLRYHMVSIYDASSSGNQYSSRAANASFCASDISTKAFRQYHRYLFGTDGNGDLIMPATGSHGRTDTTLIRYAQEALGVTSTNLQTFQECVQSEQHIGLTQSTTLNFTNRGFTAVPVVLVNGKRLKTMTVAGLDKAISSAAAAAAAAAAKAPKPKATPTPPTSGSVSGSASSAASGSPSVSPSAAASP